MNLRLLNSCAVVALGLGWQAVLLPAQSSGIRENSYKTRVPFADVSRHPKDSSPLGRVDGSVNQSIGLDATEQADDVQSRSAGLDQLQPSPRGGSRRSGLALSGGVGSAEGARGLIPSQAYVRPSYLMGPRSSMLTVADPSRHSPRVQGSSSGLRPNTVKTKDVRGLQTGDGTSARAAATYQRTLPGTGKNDLGRSKNMENMDLPSSAPDGGQSPFERLGDPFQESSRAGFEGFRNRSEFDRPCGDACSFRSTLRDQPFGRESEGRKTLGQMPDAQIPDAQVPSATKSTYGQELKPPQ